MLITFVTVSWNMVDSDKKCIYRFSPLIFNIDLRNNDFVWKRILNGLKIPLLEVKARNDTMVWRNVGAVIVCSESGDAGIGR